MVKSEIKGSEQHRARTATYQVTPSDIRLRSSSNDGIDPVVRIASPPVWEQSRTVSNSLAEGAAKMHPYFPVAPPTVITRNVPRYHMYVEQV